MKDVNAYKGGHAKPSTCYVRVFETNEKISIKFYIEICTKFCGSNLILVHIGPA